MRVRSLCSLMAAAVFAGILACGEVSFPVLPAEEFTAALSGANEIPVVTTPATGTALFAVVDDTILSYRIDVASIDSTTLSHIHLGDAATSSGGVIVTLFVGPTTCTAATVASPRCRAGYTGPLPPNQLKPSQMTQLPRTWGSVGADSMRQRFDSLLVLMRNGGVYVNVHNRANPAGHIRGQTQPL